MKNRLLSLLAVSALTIGSFCSFVSAEEQTYTIGICQFSEHDAITLATQGFCDALTEQLGNRVVFREENAQGDFAACTSIINAFVTEEVDLILANATPALQTAATATADIPVLGTSVTEYGAALQIEDFQGIVGTNVSGTSDLAPLNEQALVIQELFPEAKNIGLLYCSGEPNSQYQIDVVQSELESMGYTCEHYTFSDSNDLTSVVITASENCDVIYVPTDNTAAANAELIANVCMPAGVPVVAAEENACKLCGVATFSISYYDLGYITGEMALRVLVDGEDISQMPIAYATDFSKYYHPENCEALGLEIPEGYEALILE